MDSQIDYDILVLGEANIDLILTGKDVVPAFGQAEKLVNDLALELGGSSAIFACGAGRLGLKTGFIGKLGEDEFGDFLKKVLKSRGVDTQHIVVDSQKKTGLTLHLSRPTDRAMLTYLGTIDDFHPQEIPVQIFQRTRHVHMGSFFLQKGLQQGLVDLFKMIKTYGATISLDPGWDPDERWNGYLQPVLDQVDVFMPNEQEATHIASVKSIQEAFQKLGECLPLTVVKMGSQGAAAVRGTEIHSCRGYKVDSIDTTGAGDSFNAGFLYAYLNHFELIDCLRWGCACGALSTLSSGGIAAQPTTGEVERFLSEQTEILS